MTTLYILNENATSGFNYNILSIISFTSIICGIAVIISKNPIVSVLFLIGLFLSIACYLMILGINFIGLSYLLVYVGAVSILFLFILMLINVRISELVTDNTNSIPLAIIIGVAFNVTLHRLLPSNVKFDSNIYNLDDAFKFELTGNIAGHNKLDYALSSLFSNPNSDLSFVSSQAWDTALAEVSHITSIGNVLYTAYPLLLIITSIILLLAMVGAIVITIKQ